MTPLLQAAVMIRAQLGMLQSMSRSELIDVRDVHAARWADMLTSAIDAELALEASHSPDGASPA